MKVKETARECLQKMGSMLIHLDKWWQYQEADSFEGQVQIQNASQQIASFKVPADASKSKKTQSIMSVT